MKPLTDGTDRALGASAETPSSIGGAPRTSDSPGSSADLSSPVARSVDSSGPASKGASSAPAPTGFASSGKSPASSGPARLSPPAAHGGKRGWSAADWLAVGWSSGLGAGYFPFASGTFGTAVALPFAWALSAIGPWWGWAAAVAVFTAISVAAAHRAGRVHGVVDSKLIVSDEFAGLFLTVGLLPFTWQTAVAGFFIFRLFDIVKPWPASYFDRKVHNGFGVTFDDVIAGLYARGVLEIALRMGWLGSLPEDGVGAVLTRLIS